MFSNVATPRTGAPECSACEEKLLPVSTIQVFVRLAPDLRSVSMRPDPRLQICKENVQLPWHTSNTCMSWELPICHGSCTFYLANLDLRASDPGSTCTNMITRVCTT